MYKQYPIFPLSIVFVACMSAVGLASSGVFAATAESAVIQQPEAHEFFSADAVHQVFSQETGLSPAADFGVYVTQPDGQYLHVGISGGSPLNANGAVIATLNSFGEVETSHALDEQGIHDMLVSEDAVYIPGTDPAFGDSWAYGNVYRLQQGVFQKYRSIPRSIHGFGLAVDDAGILYYASGSHTGDVNETEGALWKSMDDGQTWQLASTIGNNRVWDVVWLHGALYVIDSSYTEGGSQETRLLKSTDGGTTWQRVDGVEPYALSRMITHKGSLILVGGQTANRIYQVTADGLVHESAFLYHRLPARFAFNVLASDGERVYALLHEPSNAIMATEDFQTWSIVHEFEESTMVPGSLAYWPAHHQLVVSRLGTGSDIVTIEAPAPYAQLSFAVRQSDQSQEDVTVFWSGSVFGETVERITWDMDNDGIIDGEGEQFHFTYPAAGTFDIRVVVETGSARYSEAVVEAVHVPYGSTLDWRIGGAVFSEPVLGNSVSASYIDVNQDQMMDIFVNQFGQNVLYQSNDSGGYNTVLVGGVTTQTAAATWADVDGDGSVEVFLADLGGSSALYARQENDVWRNITDEWFAGNAPSARARFASFVDVDNDHDLDLFISNSSEVHQLYINEGGAFLLQAHSVLATTRYGNFGSLWADIDGDGDQDVILVTFDGENAYYTNNGDGTFILADDIPFQATERTRSVQVLDIDNDLDLDVFELAYGGASHIYEQTDKGFVAKKVSEISGSPIAISFGDVDNDADQDALVTFLDKPRAVLINSGDLTFDYLSGSQAPYTCDCLTIDGALKDLNADGALDLALISYDSVNQLWYGEQSKHNWITVDVGYVPGTTVIVTTKEKGQTIRQRRDVLSSGLAGGVQDFIMHFGVGSAKKIQSIEVRYASGETTVLKNVWANQIFMTKRSLEKGIYNRPPLLNNSKKIQGEYNRISE